MKANIEIKDKDKKLLLVVGVVFFFIIDVYYIFGWQCRSLMHYYTSTNERNQQIQSMENDLRNKERYSSELGDLNIIVDDLEKLVTEEVDIPILMENISKLAGAIGVKILQIRPEFMPGLKVDRDSESDKTSENEEKFGEIAIHIAVESGFHQFGVFMSRLEAEKNLFRLSTVEVQTDSRNYLVQKIQLSLISTIKLTQHAQTVEK